MTAHCERHCTHTAVFEPKSLTVKCPRETDSLENALVLTLSNAPHHKATFSGIASRATELFSTLPICTNQKFILDYETSIFLAKMKF